jgi:hypothetical protein
MSGDGGATTRQYYYRHEIYDRMVDEWEVFDSLVDFFVFAASVGYAISDRPTVNAYGREEYQGTTDEGTRGEMLWMHFTGKGTYRTVAASIAYQHTRDSNALVDPETQLEVLARYARAGVDRLDEEFGTAASPPRDGLVSLVDKFHEVDGGHDSDDILSGIVDSFDRDVIGT